MTSMRRGLAIASLVLLPLGLAGCDEPYPGVTAWSGTSSEHLAALCWQPDPASVLGPAQCAQDVLDGAAAGEGIPRLAVAPGDVVGLSVDPVVADTGWTVQVAGQTLATDLHETYYRFPFPVPGGTAAADYTLQVTAQTPSGGSRGLWFFRLVAG